LYVRVIVVFTAQLEDYRDLNTQLVFRQQLLQHLCCNAALPPADLCNVDVTTSNTKLRTIKPRTQNNKHQVYVCVIVVFIAQRMKTTTTEPQT
jgi:hypothetical protein